MPDKKLTDNEIVKGLDSYKKDIGCAKCGFKDKYLFTVIENALNLINRLQTENKKFKDRQKPTGASGYKIENGKVVFFTTMLGGCKIVKENLEEVVKTLNELLQECYSKDEIAFALKCKTEELKTAKAEAYKEFAERLEAEYTDFDEENEVILPENLNKAINDLLKELVGEDDASKD